jgi:predicted amidohydrolase YtcJ
MADLIVLNANVIPMTVPRKRERALAVKDGRIVRVGSNRAVAELRRPETKVIDLAGQTVLPGFIDSHLHATLTGLSLNAARLETAPDVHEVLDRIRAKAQKTPAGKWVLGMGCVPWALKEGRFPTMAELDGVCPSHPVFICAVTFHSSAVNTRGFELIGIDPNMHGVEKDSAGRPTGSFLSDDSHFFASTKALGSLSDEELAELFHQVADFAVARGVTTMHCLDGQFVADDRDVYVLHKIRNSLPLHTLIMFQTNDVKKALDLGLPRIGGCLTIDGAGFEHTALFYEPYTDRPDLYGQLYIPEPALESFVTQAHQAGLQIGMHAIGDKAVDILVKAYQKAQARYPREDARHRVEHFITPTDWAMDTAADMGLALPMQPVFPFLWDTPQHSEYVRLLGPERANRLEPFVELQKRGLIISGGSDSPVTDINPLLGIHAGVNMPNPVRRVSVEEALRMFTINGAWVGKEEADKGTIEVGKLADLVVLDGDPYREPQRIKDFSVKMTIVAGSVAYRG